MDDQIFSARFESDYRARYSASPDGFVPLDFVGALGSIHGALLYSRLFLPEFIEVDGMVFLRDVLEDIGGAPAARKLSDEYGRKQLVEKDLNRFDLILNLPNQLTFNATGDDHLLAAQLVVSWQSRLQQLYPGRSFVVSAFDEDGEVGVEFYQKDQMDCAS